MKERVIFLALAGVLTAGSASASWYWPFGTNATGRADSPRLSELMEPASLAIDDATDLMSDGKTDEAVEKYREALRLLERLEVEHPERSATPEFQSVRNKRAYVDAQLNAILLEEARMNAKAVAVTDTTELERKLEKKRAGEAKRKSEEEDAKKGLAKSAAPKLESQLGEYMEGERARAKKLNRAAATARFERESEETIRDLLKEDPDSRKAHLMFAGLELHRKNFGSARKNLDELLKKNPNDVSALNLMAAVESATGDDEAAEATLAKAIRTNRNDYHAYYNLAKLILKSSRGRDKIRASRFYHKGRKVGGPKDAYLEKTFAPGEDDE